MAMATSRYCTVHHEDRLDGRIDELGHNLRLVAHHVDTIDGRVTDYASELKHVTDTAAADTLVNEIAYRLEQALARIHQLEVAVAQLEHPARRPKAVR
jgi:hypothetical protein